MQSIDSHTFPAQYLKAVIFLGTLSCDAKIKRLKSQRYRGIAPILIVTYGI